jgi:hypothetical protein
MLEPPQRVEPLDGPAHGISHRTPRGQRPGRLRLPTAGTRTPSPAGRAGRLVGRVLPRPRTAVVRPLHRSRRHRVRVGGLRRSSRRARAAGRLRRRRPCHVPPGPEGRGGRTGTPNRIRRCPAAAGPAPAPHDLDRSPTAVLHGTVPGRGFLVKLDADDGVVRVEVHDSRSRRPYPRRPGTRRPPAAGCSWCPRSPTAGAWRTALRSGRSSGRASKPRERRQHERRPHPAGL